MRAQGYSVRRVLRSRRACKALHVRHGPHQAGVDEPDLERIQVH